MTKFGSQLMHEKYEELCALATAGVLSPEESELLDVHLEGCSECREAVEQYQQLATDGMSFLATEFEGGPVVAGFDESSALNRLMQAAGKEGARQAPPIVVPARKFAWIRGLVAASIVAGIGTGAYWAGADSSNARLRGIRAESRSELDRTISEKQTLEKAIQMADRGIAVLEQQIATDQNDLRKVRAQDEADAQRIAQITAAMETAANQSTVQLTALRQERDANAAKLRDTEKMYQEVEYELSTLRNQHQQDLVQLASLRSGTARLNDQINQQSERSSADEHYLAADRDIRDLIGARNLYIADIMDVNDTGQSRKPFGRVFYTKTKSLIFYAYDLDRQPGVRLTSTFQVWGRTSPNDRKPISLGILYMDSETNRRWTLRVDNPEQLARLDSVFVTIEPHEQTERPTGKPFLYASLQRVPNHP